MTPLFAKCAAVLASAAIVSAFGAERRVGSDLGCIAGRVFVVSIGVDRPAAIPSKRLAFAEIDARRVATRFVSEVVRRDSGDGRPPSVADAEALAAAQASFGDTTTDIRVRVALLHGDSANRASVAAAIATVARYARPSDALVFYFGGVSIPLSLPQGDTGHVLLLGSDRPPGPLPNRSNSYQVDTAALGRTGLTLAELGRWMENVATRNQLVIFEAGEGTDFLTELVASLSDARPSSSALSERKRIFIGTRGLGIEGWEGGPLALAVSHSREPLTDLLCNNWSDRHLAQAAMVETRLVALADSIAGKGYAKVFHERDFLEIQARLERRRPASRGIGQSAEAAAVPASTRIGRGSVALVVGTNSYDASTWRRLSNPVHDAETLAAELRRNFGFETQLLKNPTMEEFLLALRGLARRKYADDDELLVFVAGHGYYDELLKAGYLVFRDSRPIAEDPTLQSYLPHKVLESYVNPIESKHTLVMLDACFGGAFATPASHGSARGGPYAQGSLSEWLRVRMENRSRLYITSGGKEYVSDGLPGSHSPFMRRLLAALRTAAQEGRPLSFAQLQASVERVVPEPRAGDWGDHVPGGDFVFVPASAR